MSASLAPPADRIGRYAIYDEIAAGGMATVHFGRLVGPVSFARTVAIKRLHPHLAREPEFVAMFLDEARVAARVRHPNVVPMLDIVTIAGGPPFLVMEYVQGESLARLLAALRERGTGAPVPVACAIVVGMLLGLHAAHEARDDRGQSLCIVHRDVSPQNVIVGIDGMARLLDFGVAKAAGRLQTTREGQFKGKLAYTAPEVVRGARVTRAADIYSAGVVLWEALAGERLFVGENDANLLERVLFAQIAAPSARAGEVPSGLDPVVLRALARDPAQRFATARDMARAIEAALRVASRSEVGAWVQGLAGDALAARAGTVARIERGAAELPFGDPDESGSVALDATSGSGAMASSVAEDNAPARVAPFFRRRLGTVALAGTVGAIGLVAVIGLRSPATKPQAEGSSLQTFPPPPSAPSPAPASPIADPPGFSVEDLPVAAKAPVASSTARPQIAPAAKGASRAIPPRPAAAADPPPRAVKSVCDPPWNLDAQGIKQYKLECL